MTADQFEHARHAMVISQLRPNGVTDARLVDVMDSVAREDFVPDERRAAAYADVMVPLDDGRYLNSPMVIGRLLNEARIAKGDRVLIVASATDYTATIARGLCDHVDSVDAEAALTGGEGHYDAVVIDGAVEIVPEALVARLAPRGRLVAGLVEAGVTRLAVGRRGGDGFSLVAFADAEIAVLPAFVRPRSFIFQKGRT